MTENVQIALIIGSVFVVALWMFKDRLDIFTFKASKKGVGAEMKGHQDNSTNVSKNIQFGKGNKMSAGANSSIEDNQQLGDENEMNANAANKKN